MLLFSDLSSIVPGSLPYQNEDLPILHLIYDSRKLIISPGTVFFAIRSSRRDGHKFVQDLYNQGVRQFVVCSDFVSSVSLFPNANFLLVPDSVTALQQIAAYHRKSFKIPVVGITGSNGKTIVKEWLATLLLDKYRIVRSPRSFNSQIGVPLSVWQMNHDHQLGIFEAGISRPLEMERLEPVIKPDIGIFTNIGPAHAEGFSSTKEKILEKLKLFKNSKIVIFNSDQQELVEVLREIDPPFKPFYWGESPDSDIQVLSKQAFSGNTMVILNYQGKNFNFNIPFSDPASVENGLTCAALLIYLEIPVDEFDAKFQMLHSLQMRLELKEGVNGCYIIDDAYNNDLAGLVTALQFLDQQNQRSQKSLILSDFVEYGMKAKDLYAEIASIIKSKEISKFYGIGPELSSFADLFPHGSKFYPSTKEFLLNLQPESFFREVVLVKGARKFRFEKVVHELSEKVHGTVLEINLDSISHNLNYYRSLLKPETKMMIMVKAFAYGSGSSEVASLLQFHKVDYLGVAYADEGVELRNQGVTLPIMVMNPSAHAFAKIIHYDLEPEIYSFKVLKELLDSLAEYNKTVKVHIKLDTGMHRLGFIPQDIEKLNAILKDSSFIHVQSVFTHLAGADECCFDDYSSLQLNTFTEMANAIEKSLGRKVIKHALNSAGIVRFPENQHDMVRLGIGLYGVDSSSILQNKLQNVGTLKTTISQIKELKEGDTVGYSRKGKIQGVRKIATIAIGYADGYDRRFGNGVGKVAIGGKLCPVVGNVCMDMCMVDVTEVDAREGDQVTVFGDYPQVRQVAADIDTIPYEILTKISERVKRVFYSS